MNIARDPVSLGRALARARRRGESIGFVPTMGSLHEGHAALIRRSLQTCRRTVVSIYVNPLQFESASALRRYPRSPQRDLSMLRRLGVDVAYCPSSGVFPPDPILRVSDRRVSHLYEGRLRPGHFEGVLTIVAKLFLQVRPTHAFFGEKDFQQLWLVRKLAEEFPFGLRLISAPTVRDPSTGLACSSRNRFLSAPGLRQAAWINRAIREGAKMAAVNGRPAVIESAVRRRLRARDIRVQYVSIVDTRNFSRPSRLSARRSYRLLAAALIDGVHLIDNAPVHPARRS